MLSEEDLAAVEQRFKIALNTREAKRQNDDELLSLIPSLIKAARASKDIPGPERRDSAASGAAAKKNRKIPNIIEPLEDLDKTYIAVLIDGNGYKFPDTLVESRYTGGVAAGEQLSEAIDIALEEAKVPNIDRAVRVQVYADFGVYTEGVRAFSTGFNSSFPTYIFGDAGTDVRGTHRKIEQAFRLFYNDSNCKQILLAACHSRYYLTLVQPLIELHNDRIILVKGDNYEDAFGTLYMRVVEMPSLFPITESEESSEDEEDVAPHANGGLRVESSASSSNKTTTSRSPAQSKGSSSSRGSRGRGRKDPEPARKRHRKSKPTVAPTPKSRSIPHSKPIPESKETPRWIALNKESQRIDTDLLSRPSGEVLDAFKKRPKQPCRNYLLSGYCQFTKDRCRYDHNVVDQQTLDTLHWFVQITPCNAGPGCRSSSCLHGHHCSKTGCQGGSFGKCQFPADMHNVDKKVHEMVRPEDDPDDGCQNPEFSKSPSKASHFTSPQRDGSWEVSIASGQAEPDDDNSLYRPSSNRDDAMDDEFNQKPRSHDWNEHTEQRDAAAAFEQGFATVAVPGGLDGSYDDGYDYEHAEKTSGRSSRAPDDPDTRRDKDGGTNTPNGRPPEPADDDENSAEDTSDLMTFDDQDDPACEVADCEAFATSSTTFKLNPKAAAFR